MTKKELDVLMPREMANKILKMYEWQQEVVKWFDVAPSAYFFWENMELTDNPEGIECEGEIWFNPDRNEWGEYWEGEIYIKTSEGKYLKLTFCL